MNEVLKDWGNVIFRAALILTLLFFFLWPVRLQGSSMDPTLNDEDLVCMSRFLVQMQWYERGDIVVFQYHEGGRTKTVLKRIIATEGEHIRLLRDGSIEIDGEILEESYIQEPTNGLVDMTIPAGTVFVLGDNRDVSYDSRQMGVISCKDLTGKVIFRWFPFGEIRIF